MIELNENRLGSLWTKCKTFLESKGGVKCRYDVNWALCYVISTFLSYDQEYVPYIVVISPGKSEPHEYVFTFLSPPFGLRCRCNRSWEQYFCSICKQTLNKFSSNASRFHETDSFLTFRKWYQVSKQYVNFRNKKHFLKIHFYLLFRQRFMVSIK